MKEYTDRKVLNANKNKQIEKEIFEESKSDI
jgi:hypothetical protein